MLAHVGGHDGVVGTEPGDGVQNLLGRQVVGVLIIDVSKETLTLSVIGDEKKTDAVQELLADFGIEELVRTGMIALERGKYTIDEDTKEKGEFNYGKDVL